MSAPNIRWRSNGCDSPSHRPNAWACWATTSSTPPFNFNIKVRLGAGAFVCGEETALIASIEGQAWAGPARGRHSRRNTDLWEHPTLINNVETFANIPPIIRKGGKWFAGIGTEKSKGTKVFALAGKIVNTGLIEVPMGTTLREIVFDIGGGIPDGKQIQGGADRRTFRRLHPRAVSGYAGRLRIAHAGRLDHGFRRHDRHG